MRNGEGVEMNAKPTIMGERLLFRTQKPEGAMRDVIIIEVRFPKRHNGGDMSQN